MNETWLKEFYAVLEKIKKVGGFGKVKFIILYSSAAEGQMVKGSDTDFCIDYAGSSEESSRFRFKVLSELLEDIMKFRFFSNSLSM